MLLPTELPELLGIGAECSNIYILLIDYKLIDPTCNVEVLNFPILSVFEQYLLPSIQLLPPLLLNQMMP